MIKIATEANVGEILEIYAFYVKNTAISFEWDVPEPEEFRERIRNTLKRYPYFVYVQEGKILGYAYAGPFIWRSAYDWAAEATIYVAPDQRKNGIGRELYRALETALRLQNVINVNACIGYPAQGDDEYLTKNSVQYHEHMGYRLVGQFHKCGYKFGRWYDMVWMEKCLSNHPDVPERVKPFDEIRDTLFIEYGIS